MATPAILDSLNEFWTISEEYLEVFIIEQNLVGIAAVVLIIRKFEYFVRCA